MHQNTPKKGVNFILTSLEARVFVSTSHKRGPFRAPNFPCPLEITHSKDSWPYTTAVRRSRAPEN